MKTLSLLFCLFCTPLLADGYGFSRSCIPTTVINNFGIPSCPQVQVQVNTYGGLSTIEIKARWNHYYNEWSRLNALGVRYRDRGIRYKCYNPCLAREYLGLSRKYFNAAGIASSKSDTYASLYRTSIRSVPLRGVPIRSVPVVNNFGYR